MVKGENRIILNFKLDSYDFLACVMQSVRRLPSFDIILLIMMNYKI